MKCISILANEYLKDTKIKSYYLPYIAHIKYHDGLSQSDLKEFIPFDKSRISVVVRELVDLGLVYNSATGRNSCLHLTENGLNAFSLCKMFMNLLKKEIFVLTPEEETFVRKLNLSLNERLDGILAKYDKP